jgi:Carboxypeptidase regulatory-like domain/TonB dependent receptor
MWRRLTTLRICMLLALSLVSTSSFAQARFAVHGTVTDSTGAAVSAVTLVLQKPGQQTASEATSSANGDFDLSAIPPGDYVLSIPATQGFAAQDIPLRVTASIPTLKIKLALDAVAETVNVDNEQPLSTSAADNKDAVTVSGTSLQKLPVFDQDYITALIPFLDPGSSSAGGLTIMVDGVEMKASTVSPSAIAEVHMNNDPYSAEYGRPGRGRIDLITKPGSPNFHGTFNFIARDAVFNAQTYPETVRPPEQRRIYEGHFTGPLGHDGHTTFLISGDRKEQDTEAAVYAQDEKGGVPVIISANVPNPRRDNQISGRVSHDFSSAHRFSVGYNFEYSTRKNSGVGGIVFEEAGVDTVSREDDLIFNDRIIITPNLLNQLQITLEKDEDVTRSVTNAPSILVQETLTKGGAQADASRTENTIHINEIVSWTHKQHYIRFGANMPQLSRRAVDDQTNRLGTFKFNSLADYTSNSPYVLNQQQGIGRGLYWINEIGGFIQDEIKVRKNLQATIGLRYQWQTYISSNNNFAPRASVAYSATPRTILRAGTGLFYDRTGGDFPATFKLHNGVVLRSFQIRNPGYPNALPPGQPITAKPSNIVRMDPHVHTPYSIQYSISVERQLIPNLTLTAGYRGITGIRNFRSRDANAFRGTYGLDAPPTPRPDPAFGQIQQIEAEGRSISNNFDLSLRGRIGRWFDGQAQYTFGHSSNNTGGIGFFPQDQYNPGNEWARADFDRRHRFNLIGNINPDHWLTLGISATLYSGSPYTELSGQDYFYTGLGNARPSGIGRNTLETAGTADLDLMWDHDLHLNKAKGEHAKILNFGLSAFNVLNHANFANYAGTVTSTRFLQPTSASPGRQLQFGLRYQF